MGLPRALVVQSFFFLEAQRPGLRVQYGVITHTGNMHPTPLVMRAERCVLYERKRGERREEKEKKKEGEYKGSWWRAVLLFRLKERRRMPDLLAGVRENSARCTAIYILRMSPRLLAGPCSYLKADHSQNGHARQILFFCPTGDGPGFQPNPKAVVPDRP